MICLSPAPAKARPHQFIGRGFIDKAVMHSKIPAMGTVTIPKKEYNNLLKRQWRVEEELEVIKGMLKKELEEDRVKPHILKKWERISRDLDRGKGRSFSSPKEMQKWLRNL